MMTDAMVKGEEQRFDVRDGQRPVTFVGWHLASADSQSGSDVRWTELSLYKTLNERYVLEKIGRSDVFHSADCKRRSKGAKHESLAAALGDEDPSPEDAFVPCTDCHPSYDVQPAWIERDISAVAVHPDAQTLVKSLYRDDREGMPFLSRVSRELLDAAVLVDTDIAAVVQAPTDIT